MRTCTVFHTTSFTKLSRFVLHRRPSKSYIKACGLPHICAAAGRGQTLTDNEHRPKSHRAHLEWTPSRMVHWAQTIGPNTSLLFERIMADKPHPEMGYRACLGIIRLAAKYSPVRMEAAAER